jgi:hypothetical protein
MAQALSAPHALLAPSPLLGADFHPTVCARLCTMPALQMVHVLSVPPILL